MDKFKNKYRIQSHRKPNWDYSSDALYFLTIVTQNRECNLGTIVNNEMILSDFGKIVEREWLSSFEIREELILHEFVIMPNHLHTIVEIYNENRGELDGDGLDGDGGTDGGDMNGDGLDGDCGDTDCGDTDGGDTDVETHGRVSLPANIINPTNTINPMNIINPVIIINPANTINPNDPINPLNPINPTNPIEHNNEITSIKRNAPIRLPKSISSFMAGVKSAGNTKNDDYINEQNFPIPKYNRKNHFFQPNYHDHILRNHIEYRVISNYIISNPQNWEKDTFNG